MSVHSIWIDIPYLGPAWASASTLNWGYFSYWKHRREMCSSLSILRIYDAVPFTWQTGQVWNCSSFLFLSQSTYQSRSCLSWAFSFVSTFPVWGWSKNPNPSPLSIGLPVESRVHLGFSSWPGRTVFLIFIDYGHMCQKQLIYKWQLTNEIFQNMNY